MGMLYCCQKKHKLIDVIILAVIGMDSLSSHLIISPLCSDKRATSNKNLVIIRRLKVAKGSQKRIFVVFFLFFRRATKFVLTNWPMLIFLIEIKPYKHNRNSKDTGTGTERDEAIHPASNGSP